jgi:FtsP/CotA-like multicopper oxidase with cupredoxin domain
MTPVDYSVRRRFLKQVVTAVGAVLVPRVEAAPAAARTLRAALARVDLVGKPHPATDVWAYERSVPGPELRARQGERLRIEFVNALPAASTVHWHGVRVPNAMDGVPHVTQPPVAPNGGRFVYEFLLEDAGTFWYHPHLGSPEQVGRGLYGALIVEEQQSLPVDRDVVWVLGDWRLDGEARIVGDFRNFMDASHAGRIGNTVTVNGKVPEAFDVRAGERIRLRLVNAANARIFGLGFRGHAPLVIALDGHPVEPHAPAGGRVVLGPGMRADVLLDATGDPGATYTVVDDFYPRQAYRLLDLRYSERREPGRAKEPVPRLARNPVTEPDLSDAQRHLLRFEGGMMGGIPMERMASASNPAASVWTINGKRVLEKDHGHEPILKLAHRRSYLLELVNETAWHHPIHLHGHVFRVLSRDGKPALHREWADTVLISPRSRAEVAFVADNPGDWMLHCHVLEHQASGMMAVVRVG